MDTITDPATNGAANGTIAVLALGNPGIEVDTGTADVDVDTGTEDVEVVEKLDGANARVVLVADETTGFGDDVDVVAAPATEDVVVVVVDKSVVVDCAPAGPMTHAVKTAPTKGKTASGRRE